MKKTIGIIFADGMEFLPFVKLCQKFEASHGVHNKLNTFTFELNDTKVVAIESGIGKVNAGFATATLAMDFKATHILNAGLSGAISELVREDILACTSFVECDFDLSAIGYKLGEKSHEKDYVYYCDTKLLSYVPKNQDIKQGAVGTGDIFLTDKQRKRLYHNVFSIKAFDMETAAIAAICDKFDLPFLSIRKISDDADDCSASAYREMNDRAETCLAEILLTIINNIDCE